MRPLIEIQCIESNVYSYRVSARGGTMTQATEDTFASVEECLRDAGCALGHYFVRADVSLSMGSYTTEALRNNPKAIAARIEKNAPLSQMAGSGLCERSATSS